MRRMGAWSSQVTATVVVFLALIAPVSAGAATIGGTVTDAVSGDPLPRVVVDVFDYDPGSATWISGAFGITGSGGTYSVPAVSTGEHKVGFNAFGDLPTYGVAYWRAKPNLMSADTVDVIGDLAAIDATLSVLVRSLNGTVTTEGGGVPIPDVVVTAYRLVGSEWEVVAYTYSHEDGSYSFWGLEPGSYRIGFEDPVGVYAPEFYDNAQAVGDGVDVPVPSAGVSAALRAVLPSASGATYRASGGQAISGAVVTAYRYDDTLAQWVAIEDTITAADGTWSMWGLGSDTWRFGATDPTTVHAPGFYDHAVSLAAATGVVMTPGVTVGGIDIPMISQRPSMRGSVTDSVTGGPVEGCRVDVYQLVSGPSGESWESFLTTTTVADGTWDVYGLYDGTWRINFNPASTSAPDYFEQYFSETRDFEQAQRVLTKTGYTIDGISVRLVPRPPSVVGTVTRIGTSDVIAGARVTATRVAPPGASFAATTTASGGYTLKALPDGEYVVRFDDPARVGGTYPYRAEYFDDASTAASATLVSVAESFTAVVDENLVLDESIAPRTSVRGTTSSLRAVTVSVVATEPADESGIRQMYYRLDGGATVTVDPLTPVAFEFSTPVTATGLGEHRLQHWALDWAGNTSAPVTTRLVVLSAPVSRIAGPDRFAMSVALAKADNPAWTSVSDVIIACGDDRAAADPLAAAGLCWAYEKASRPAPLLLVGSGSVAPVVENAIGDIVAKNGTVTLRVVGGPVSVPDARIVEIRAGVAARLHITLAQATSRVRFERLLATGGRFDLAAAIADRMVARRGSLASGTVLVANGADATKFYDALALTPIAAHRGFPILLVSADGVPAATGGALKRLGVPAARRYAAGGPATVKPAVLAKLGIAESRRMWGEDRCSTAVAVAERAAAEGWLGYTEVGIAAKLPDALTGGVLMGSRSGVLLFTGQTQLDSSTGGLLNRVRGSVDRCTVFGGTKSLPEVVAQQAAAALH